MNIIDCCCPAKDHSCGKRLIKNGFAPAVYDISDLFRGLVKHDVHHAIGDMYPAIEMIDGSNSIKIKAEIPGVDKDNLHVYIKGNSITIKGKKEKGQLSESDTHISCELSYGSFQRTITVPKTADLGMAEAAFKDGMLMIEAPKRVESLEKERKLDIL